MQSSDVQTLRWHESFLASSDERCLQQDIGTLAEQDFDDELPRRGNVLFVLVVTAPVVVRIWQGDHASGRAVLTPCGGSRLATCFLIQGDTQIRCRLKMSIDALTPSLKYSSL